MRVGVRDLLRLPPRGVRVAIDKGLFLRFVRHNPTPHPPLGSLRSAVSHRGHLAGAYMFRAVSTAGDFSTNARNDIVFVCFYTAGDLRPTFNTAERKKIVCFFGEAIFDENFKRLPHSRDKFRCSARQTRRKSPDSTTGTAGDLRPTFNTAERENYSANTKLILPSPYTPPTFILMRSPKRKV